MRKFLALSILLFLGGCVNDHYTIPDETGNNVGKVVSSGRSPQDCMENLQDDAKKLGLKVRLTDVNHEGVSGPIAWLYASQYHCTGVVMASAR
ncbi:MAG: hypothetical protein ACT4OO_01480 [Nitrospiraceae bacterium]